VPKEIRWRLWTGFMGLRI